jgi:hypothetical protein
MQRIPSASSFSIKDQQRPARFAGSRLSRREQAAAEALAACGGVDQHLADLGAMGRVRLMGESEHDGPHQARAPLGDEQAPLASSDAGQLAAPERPALIV